MKLTEEHIHELYRFTRAHYVEHYDLQTELVDHLANGICAQWEENPERSFEAARDIEFKKFGVFGFMDIVDQRKRALQKRYLKIVWGFFREWFSLPKVMATLAAILVIFTVLNALPPMVPKNEGLTVLFMGLALFYLFRVFQLQRRNNQGQWRKWLLKDIIHQQGLLLQTILVMGNIFNFGTNLEWPHTILGLGFLSLLVVTFLLLTYICGYVIPAKTEHFLRETYPEYQTAA
ncbi:hypothetical protein [Maribacter sp. 2307ULW6-5]|uniref:hypothetical protein n=1 Tax=Maribacter sp. 2307ULW6-5 TaxID=3386275 RepID=UPI0039BC4A42